MNSQDKDYISLIDTLFNNNLKFVVELSSFLCDSLNNNWLSLRKATSENKYERSKNNILNIIKKIEILEKKKKVSIEQLISFNLSLINDMNVGRGAIKIEKKLKNISYVYELYQFLILEYDKNKIKTVAIKKVNHENEIKYVTNVNGYVYANMSINKGSIVFNKKSFDFEKSLFYQCLNSKGNLDFNIPLKYVNNFAPSEKKRKVYMNSMYNLYKSINLDLLNHNIDDVIRRTFYYANRIALEIYNEIFEYNRKNPKVNVLWHETIKSYGSSVALIMYEKLFLYIKEQMLTFDKVKIMQLDSICKYEISKNKLFKFVNDIVPSPVDICSACSSLVIKNINKNYNFYLRNMDEVIKSSLQYMNVEEMVEFYNNFKHCLVNNQEGVSYFIKLQKAVVREIGTRINKTEQYIVKNHLKDESLF